MPTIIDSLFLELGIDTSKFSADQKKALEKIKNFESQTKRAGDKAVTHVKRVGEAFRDIADDTSIGASARRLDAFSAKLRGLGQSARVSGGVSGGLGMMAEGLGALLSPAALGVAALGLLGKGTWDLNEKMTAMNATLARQSRLAGMNAKSLWSWGEASKTIGGSATGTESGIAGLQTAIAGMSIGAGNATPQLVGLARLSQYGARWNMRTGVDIPSLFKAVHAMGKQQGWARTWALVSNYGLMNQSEFNLAMRKKGGLAAYEYAKHAAPPSFNSMVRKSLESQSLLGKKDIQEAALAERAYSGVQSPMQKLVGLVTDLIALTNSLLGYTIKIADWVGSIAEHFGIKLFQTAKSVIHGAESGWKKGGVFGAVTGAAAGYHQAINADIGRKMVPVVRALMSHGLGRRDAEALAGNFMQESSLNPHARNGQHMGLAQWSSARQALARQNGFDLKSEAGQIAFAVWELHNTPYGKQALARMRAAHGLRNKTLAADAFFERSGELSYDPKTARYGILGVNSEKPVTRRIGFARDVAAAMQTHGRLALEMRAATNMHANMAHAIQQAQAYQRSMHNITTHHTRIDAVNVATQATDAEGMARGARKALSAHPLIGPTAQHQVTLSTHGMAG